MAYKFNLLSGRLGSATPHMAYAPAGLRPTVETEPAPLIWEQTPKPPAVTRSPMGGDGMFGSLIRNRVFENQKLFQINDGIPIHLKKGLPDKISFGVIMALSVVGTVWTCYSLYEMSKPKN